MNSTKSVVWVSVIVAVIIAAIYSFYQFFTYRAPETGFLRRSTGEVANVVGGNLYFKMPRDNVEFYPLYNLRDIEFTRLRDNGGTLSGKVSLQYTYMPGDIMVSRESYESLIELWVWSASIEIAEMTNEGDMVTAISDYLHKYTNKSGLSIKGILLSSVEITDPIVKRNEETRRRRAARQAQAELTK